MSGVSPRGVARGARSKYKGLTSYQALIFRREEPAYRLLEAQTMKPQRMNTQKLEMKVSPALCKLNDL